MNIKRKLENEKRNGIWKIVLSIIGMSFTGYFLYVLIRSGFFIGWEVYFALGCWGAIFILVIILDFRLIYWMHYSISLEDNKVRIKDGFFSRAISIPVSRIYYISSVRHKNGKGYDSIFITDKKITHDKIRVLGDNEIKDRQEHLAAASELKDRYPDKVFYYYRVVHHGYRFMYYFYLLYRCCERCRFSDTSMELVKRYVDGR